MQNIHYILSLTSPIFLLIFIGYLVVKAGWMPKDNVRSLSWFVVNIGLPAALFKALSSRTFQDILHYDFLFVYGLASLLSFASLFLITRMRHKSITECALFGLGASLSNSLMIGFPIITQLFGDEALVPFSLALIVENLLILPLAIALADYGQQQKSHFITSLNNAISNLVKSPIILSITLGIICSAINFQPPVFINNAINVLALTVAGVSLFAIGGALVGLKTKGMLAEFSSVMIGKLCIHPLCVFTLLIFFPGIPLLFQHVAIILACMPMFGIFAMIGMRYQQGEVCSAMLLATTIMSFLSINIAIFFVLS